MDYMFFNISLLKDMSCNAIKYQQKGPLVLELYLLMTYFEFRVK